MIINNIGKLLGNEQCHFSLPDVYKTISKITFYFYIFNTCSTDVSHYFLLVLAHPLVRYFYAFFRRGVGGDVGTMALSFFRKDKLCRRTWQGSGLYDNSVRGVSYRFALGNF